MSRASLTTKTMKCEEKKSLFSFSEEREQLSTTMIMTDKNKKEKSAGEKVKGNEKKPFMRDNDRARFRGRF